nr:hypothetical protein [Phenylobacterium sp.]
MRVKPWAVFFADFPDDQIENEREIVIFGGRNVALAIGEILARLGCEVSTPEYGGERGWEFGATFEGQRFWCLVSSFRPAFFMNFEGPSIFLSSPRRDQPGYVAIAQRLSDALAQDPRFHDIQWYSREEGPPEPPDAPSDWTPINDRSESDPVLEDLARQIVEPRRPLTRSQYISRVLVGLGFWLGFCTVVGALQLLARGDLSGFAWLPAGVVMLSLAVLGTIAIRG